uniref:Uncharacterized protein n=1 Tax=Cucumis melo TaxID=3656 RepID=A0A9I9EAF6_CUCME
MKPRDDRVRSLKNKKNGKNEGVKMHKLNMIKENQCVPQPGRCRFRAGC